MRHLCNLFDLSVDEVKYLIGRAIRLKAEHAQHIHHAHLSGKVLGLLFQKPSLRTRVSFEAAMAHLGGSAIFLSGSEIGLGKRESIADVGKIMSTYVDLLAVRTFTHDTVTELAANAHCPVINALSDESHPCQALADVCTLQEHFGKTEGLKVTFVGDANNVSRSLATACAYTGIDFVLSSPDGYRFSEAFLKSVAGPDMTGKVSEEGDPHKAVEGADCVYTDVWASMGQEEESEARKKIFAPYQVNEKLFAAAKPTAVFLHCLPAHRGEEVTAEVIDGPRSMIVEQAAYRLHAQKALMLWLITEAK